MSQGTIKSIEELERDQTRLEELLFLVDAPRRPRIHKMLGKIRAQITALTTITCSPSLVRLREQRRELEERLFVEPAERRAEIKQSLTEVRASIDAEEAAALAGVDGQSAEDPVDVGEQESPRLRRTA